MTRVPHPEDRRSIRPTLTKRGKEFAERLRRMRADLGRQLFDSVPKSQLGMLRGQLEVVVDRLRQLLDASEAEHSAPL